MMPIKLILHYSNGERKKRSGIYEGGLAWEYTGIHPFGYKGKKTYLVYNKDIGFQNTFIGSILPINDFTRVVDIDVNSRESMEKQGEWNYINTPEKSDASGVSIRPRCELEFDSQKSTFLDGYLTERLEISKKGIDIMSLITGLGLGGMAIIIIQELLAISQGVNA